MSGGRSGARSSGSGTGGTRRPCRSRGERTSPRLASRRNALAHRRSTRVPACPAVLRLHPVSGKFPDGSEPDSSERAQNEDIMKQTSPAEPQPEPERDPEPVPESGMELTAEDSTRRLLVLCFILAVAYLASVGELEPLWAKVQPHLEPLLQVVVRNGPPAESGSEE